MTVGLRRLQRLRALIAIAERALAQCLGARSALWLSRSIALSAALTFYWFARTAPDLVLTLLRYAIAALSWTAGLAALSAAGRAPERALVGLRGVLAPRGLDPSDLVRVRPLATALWIARHTGALALLLVVLAFGLAPEPAWALAVVRTLAGVAFYVLSLALGLGLLAHVCQRSSPERGQSLLIALVWLPEALGAAYPELSGVVSLYGHLLRVCLGVEA